MRNTVLLLLSCCIIYPASAFANPEGSILRASPGHVSRLFENERLASPSGNYVLVMQPDGNLVLYRGECVDNATPRCAVWHTHTSREPGNYHLAVQDDGNLVIYRGHPPDDASKAIWDSHTSRAGGDYYLAVQDDGNVVIYQGRGPHDNSGAIWSSGTARAPMPAPERHSILRASPGHVAYLFENRRLASPSGNYVLVMQPDGNLALYLGECVDNATPTCAVWDTHTFREPGDYHLAVQDDGNLVIYRGHPPDDASKAIWDSHTSRAGGDYYLAVEDDGNVVIYQGRGPEDNRGAIWSRKTGRIR